jgi:hypothetical protein
MHDLCCALLYMGCGGCCMLSWFWGRMGCLVEYVGLFVQLATLEDHDSLKEGQS